MTSLLWTLRQWARKLGKTGLAGLALLAAALLLYVVDVLPQQADIDANAARIAALETELAQRRALVAAIEKPRNKPALAATAAPTITVAAERVRELQKLAARHDIVLRRGQYTPAPVSGTTLVRWQILLPVDAPYPAIRGFVADSLAAIPTLALEDFRVKRETIGAASVAADLRFNLYLQEVAP
jgi:hypothetical protein